MLTVVDLACGGVRCRSGKVESRGDEKKFIFIVRHGSPGKFIISSGRARPLEVLVENRTSDSSLACRDGMSRTLKSSEEHLLATGRYLKLATSRALQGGSAAGQRVR